MSDSSKSPDARASARPVPADNEIEAAAARLERNWLQPGARPRAAGAGTIVQNLAHGRSHMVTVEVKRPNRRPRDTRRDDESR